QQLVFDLGSDVASSKEGAIINDRQVREWLANVRNLPITDSRLESLLTIREQLAAGGLEEFHRYKVDSGKRHAAFGNGPAVEAWQKLIAEGASKEEAWKALVEYLRSIPELLRAANPEEEEM